MATITISRETGSDRREFAPELARLLGYDLLDKEIIDLVARAIHAQDVPDVEEMPGHASGVQGVLETILKEEREGVHPPQISPWFAENYPFEMPHYYDTDYQRYSREVMQAPPARTVTRETAVKGYEQIIRRFAERGGAVIVGRGSQAVLREMPWVFHLRLTASRKSRTANVAERTGLSDDEAERYMDRSDLWRARYLRENYGVEWSDPSLYHMTVNMDKWKSYKLAEAIAAMVRDESFRQTLQDLRKHYGEF